MVTGVETAGLVLGSLSILISVLENYENAIRPTKEFFSWRKHQRKLIAELYLLRVSYHQAICLLLKPVAEYDDLNKMMEDPLSDLWTTGSIADKLQDTLGLVYTPLVVTINEIADILGSTAAHLKLQDSQQGNTTLQDMILANSRGNLTSPRLTPGNANFMSRIRFSARKNAIKSSLERLEACTQRIDVWVEKAAKIHEEPTVSREKVEFTGSLIDIQGNASRVYHALLENRCKSQSQHPTLLLLEQRVKRLRVRENPGLQHCSAFMTTAESNCFKLSLDGECCLPSQIFNTELRVVENITSTRARVTLATPDISPPYADLSTLPQVTNICRYIGDPASSPVGFCIDNEGDLRVYPFSNELVQFHDRDLTLEDILPNLQARLPLEKLYRLVVTIVASVLQLSPTLWLDHTWDKKDIIFLRTSSRPPLSVDIRYPYRVSTSMNKSLPSHLDTPRKPV